MNAKPSFHLISALALCTVLLLAGCGRKAPPDMKIGDPYTVNGSVYYPEYDPSYDETGMGSWYGPGFHGKKTASGEKFNENDLTAAHPTLPMPSLVRVTNLENGKSVVVRINDRGPFKSRRIIDLSKKSAQRIGMHSTIKVRVKYLTKETEEYLATVRATGKAPNMFDFNDRIDHGLNEPEPEPKVVIAKADTSDDSSSEEVPVESVKMVDEGTAESAPAQEVKVVDMMPPTKTNSAPSIPTKAEPVELYHDNDADRPRPWKGAAAEADADAKPFTPPPVKGRAAASPAPVEKKRAEPSLFGVPGATPAPEASAAASDESGYFVQVGSFGNPENAQKLASKLAGVAVAKTDTVTRGDKQWSRVRLGPFNTRQEAAAALEKVRVTVPDAHITH